MQADMRSVLVYRDRLLAPSETFIRGQGEGLTDYVAHYLGASSVAGLDLPASRSRVLNEGSRWGRFRELAFKQTGRAPGLDGWLRRVNPALVHAHFGPDGATALRLAERMAIPLVVTFHGYDVTMSDPCLASESRLARAYVGGRRRLLRRRGTIFLAVSQFVRERLLAQGFPAERTLLHYVGIDTRDFRPQPRPDGVPVVLFVGRLVENKGCEHLIEAMAAVRQRCPEARTVIIGDGPLRESLERRAGQVLGDCTFLGVQPPEVVREWLRRATVFCVPSVTVASGASEAFGLVFIEAQASGVPVVSFRTGGIAEAVEHGETGFLAPERDVRGLAVGIAELIENRELWNRFSQRGAERVRTRFDLRAQTARLQEIYGKALEIGGPHRASARRSSLRMDFCAADAPAI